MSILIKGMEMPKNCEDCHLESFCSLWVEARRICKWSPDNREASIRHPDCPLVPIPPHGRLIDADALKETMKIITRTEVQEIVEFDRNVYKIDDAPTIIPASEEGE